MTVEVVRPDAVEADESTPGVARTTVFETQQAVKVRLDVASGTSSGWHHHGDRHVYGYLVAGEATG